MMVKNCDKKLNWGEMGDKEWAFSILSDAQEHLTQDFWNPTEANNLINKAKKCLLGKYKSDGFFIEFDEVVK